MSCHRTQRMQDFVCIALILARVCARHFIAPPFDYAPVLKLFHNGAMSTILKCVYLYVKIKKLVYNIV